MLWMTNLVISLSMGQLSSKLHVVVHVRVQPENAKVQCIFRCHSLVPRDTVGPIYIPTISTSGLA